MIVKHPEVMGTQYILVCLITLEILQKSMGSWFACQEVVDKEYEGRILVVLIWSSLSIKDDVTSEKCVVNYCSRGCCGQK